MLKSIAAAALSAALITSLDAGSASAASFNCRTAALPAERAVCTGPYLSRLDDDLAYWYGKAKLRARYFGQMSWLRSEQRAWLRERNACGWNRACLRSAYEERIEWLRNYAEHV
jgi:uncharacterized protein